ncbi:NUDIX hydrolase [Kitasatospora sp. CB01950]|uniref:NUDIX hydrolase n=1 Tax=Kitasatospora sp. CB01950 TaxID=1703930 RepID=UPI00093CABD4|nr:NUDIX domain-containing protein [Kitasatospora sp. CB01950]OKJ17405.1 NUDIX hydrolase [Kitasatospora sp. CB01950]
MPEMPPSWPARIRALATGELVPAAPRAAATVVLLRDSATGPEAYLLRRRTTMAFAGGMYAYPGGGVDPRDREVRPPWAGPSTAEWAERLGVDEPTACAVVCAAVRETFEEAGVLLAGPDDRTLVEPGDRSAERAALESHELSLAEFLRNHQLVLRSDLLAAWARWVTPEFEERRFDTWFFVAALPAGQAAADTVGEADRVAWMTPADAVAGFHDGRFGMMPPTVTVLRELTPVRTAAEALTAAADRKVTPVLGRAELAGDRMTVRWPGYDELTVDGVFPA